MTDQIESHTHSDILRLWPSRTAIARDLSINYWTIQAWEYRNNIPQPYWEKIINAAKSRGIKVTLNALMAGAKKPTPRRRKAAPATLTTGI